MASAWSSVVRLLVADDHPLVRDGVRAACARESDIAIVGEAADGDEILSLVGSVEADIVVLDIHMPRRNGFDVLAEMKRRRFPQRVLVLSMHPEATLGVRALKAGAAGYLNKECLGSTLVAAVRRIAAGGLFVSEALSEKLARGLTQPAASMPHEQLSEREFQILCLIAGGETPRQIAARLHLSINTLSTYRGRILRKLGARGTAELIRYALENRLIS